jgi:hypothetical protein
MSRGLAGLQNAAAGDLLGVALGHGVGPRYPGGALSEYECAFVSTGDGRSCDGTAIRLTQSARSVLTTILPRDLGTGDMARVFHWALGAPKYKFETVHFAHFTTAFVYDDQYDIRDIRIFLDQARDGRAADRRIVELSALFAFLGEWHTTLNRYRYELPTPDMLRPAA